MNNHNIIILAISPMFVLLNASPALSDNFTLSDSALMSLDSPTFFSYTSIVTRQEDVAGPGVEFDIHFPGNEYPDSSIAWVSSDESGTGLLSGINVSMYDNFDLKFTLVSIDGISTPDVGGLIHVGAMIGPSEDSLWSYRPSRIDLVSGTSYSPTAVSSTTVETDYTSLLGIHIWLYEPSDWSPLGTDITLLVEAAPDAVPIPEPATLLLLGLGTVMLRRKRRAK